MVRAKDHGDGAQAGAAEVGSREKSVSICSARLIRRESWQDALRDRRWVTLGSRRSNRKEGASTSGRCPGSVQAPTGGRLWSSPSPAPRGPAQGPSPIRWAWLSEIPLPQFRSGFPPRSRTSSLAPSPW